MVEDVLRLPEHGGEGELGEYVPVHYLPYLLLGVVEDVLGFAEHGGEGELGGVRPAETC